VRELARILQAGVVAVVATFGQAVFATQVAVGGPATPRYVFLLGATATLIGAVAVNMATAHAGSQAVGDVPETDRTALSGVHHHKAEQQDHKYVAP
jgi:hypothetical protein